MLKLYFATGNRGKFREAREILKGAADLRLLKAEIPEIRSDSIEEVCRKKWGYCSAKFKNKNVVVEDAGLFIKSLDGFPATYSSFVLKKLGCAGILKLMKRARDRRAEFVSTLCFRGKLFKGVVRGSISNRARGKGGFGFDPIFIPSGRNPGRRTFGEMPLAEKNRMSHRARAFGLLRNYLSSARK